MPEPTPRERAATLRAGAENLADAREALRRAHARMGDVMDRPECLEQMIGALTSLANDARRQAQQLERDA